MKLTLPLPPSLNEMLDLAKQRNQKRKPVIYAGHKAAYEVHCDVWSREAGIFPPKVPLKAWKLRRAAFYVHNRRDPIELMAGLKWPVDWLVKRGFVEDDSDRELRWIPYPEQQIERKALRVELEIEGIAP